MRWLEVLHQQWMAARKRRVTAAVQAFRRDWETLLDEAGLKTHEDRQAAQREASSLPLKLVPNRRKPKFIDRIEVPLESEAWLHERFGTRPATDAQARSLAVVREFQHRPHVLLPDFWPGLCQRLKAAFQQPRVLGPFDWHQPEDLHSLLELLWAVTCREWPEGTLIRDASTQLGLDSKGLEARQNAVERALELLFEREMPLEALGIQTRNSVLHYGGPLTLHGEKGEKTLGLRFESTLALAELEQAERISTTARRVLLVENHKTTFLQLIRANPNHDTLIVATSFPTQAVRTLLHKLPADLPLHHFGDTDPSGWAILNRLREVAGREVTAFQMHWRPRPGSPALSPRDRQILARLLAEPRMTDCQASLRAMLESGSRGEFEQESLGPPTLQDWPFYA